MKKIHKCTQCSQYTLMDDCPKCGAKAVIAGPAKYSVPDSYGQYRREAKRKDLEDKGLL